jgi:hypothetical protein
MSSISRTRFSFDLFIHAMLSKPGFEKCEAFVAFAAGATGVD